MGSTITEKILAAHSGKTVVKPGELLTCRVDLVLGNDITAPPAIKEFEKIGVDRVFDKDKVILVPDHFTPCKDIQSAQLVSQMREFAKKMGITHFYEIGEMGIEHALLPEEGLISPGNLIIGADSHTCTYGALGAFSTGIGSTDMAAAMATGEIWLKVPASIKFIYEGKLQKWVSGKDLILYTIGQIGVDGARYMAMEFTGPVIKELSMDSKFTMANMAIEAGAKNGIFEYPGSPKSDPDAIYNKEYRFDVSKIEPQVAFPHLPSNVKTIREASKMNIKIDQVFIGSCTNGRIEDLRIAASVLKGRKKHKDIRLIIIPATRRIYRQAIQEGLMEIFIEAEAAISTPTCGPCLGGHMGVLAEGERCIATTNRNFVGRMGHPKSEVYLSNPAIAAASAVLGRIGSQEEL